MNEIKFSYNWNNKLNCKAFTTIRIHNSNKYKIGSLYQIFLKKELIKYAEIIDIKHLKIDSLNDYIAYIDTGYSLNEMKDILIKMYPKLKTDKNILFDFILLKTVKK